jgi:acetate---CoA ligase (ADP-forming) subunit beta
LAMGLVRDPTFGPCVMFGLGGILTEVLGDAVFRRAPLEPADAGDMMEEIRGRRILEAVRGMPAADRGALAGMLLALGRLGLDHEEIAEIDLNPVILAGAQPVVADALIVLR